MPDSQTFDSAQDFGERLTIVRQRVTDAGGSVDAVQLVAVTKTLPTEDAYVALEAGIVDLGENYAQALAAKAQEVALQHGPRAVAVGRSLDTYSNVRWHMIGNVQRNKVKKLVDVVSLWQTVDRVDLGTEIAKRAPGAAILVQVNTTGEDQKAGVAPGNVDRLVEDMQELGLNVRGLMTVGPTDRSADPRPAFALLRDLGSKNGLSELSMGMSGDIEAAISEGSTMIRVGTALFGPRDKAN